MFHISNAAVAHELHAGSREPQQEVGGVSDRVAAATPASRQLDARLQVVPVNTDPTHACPANTAGMRSGTAATRCEVGMSRLLAALNAMYPARR